MLRRTAAVALLTSIAALAAALPASASTLAVDAGGTLRFTAGPGEVNRVNATDLTIPGTTVVTDTGSVIAVGPGCSAVTAHEAHCPEPPSSQTLAIDLRDGNDSATAFKLAFGAIEIDGGLGNDTLDDAPQSGAVVDGGPGADTIGVHPNFGGRVDVHGGGGDDHVTATAATGAIDGGAGDDRIDAVGFINPGGGPTGSSVLGGFGDDRITAGDLSSFELADGGPGNDRITSVAGAVISRVLGGSGIDAILASSSSPAATFIDAGDGLDLVDGGGGGDTIDCGAGLDFYARYAGDAVTRCELPMPPGLLARLL